MFLTKNGPLERSAPTNRNFELLKSSSNRHITMAIMDNSIRQYRKVGSLSHSQNSPGKKRLALHRSLKNEVEIHIPRSHLWKRGNVLIRGVYTGIPLLAVNYEMGFQNHLQPKKWLGKNTLALISEVDPGSGRFGRIVGMIRREGPKNKESIYLYTYFRSFEAQTASFLDREFCQNTMYRYGEFIQGRLGRPKHSFARVVGVTKDGQARMKIVCETRLRDFPFNPLKRLAHRCRNESNIELRDPQSGDIVFSRDHRTQITTIGQGQNMIVAVCLSYMMDWASNAMECNL